MTKWPKPDYLRFYDWEKSLETRSHIELNRIEHQLEAAKYTPTVDGMLFALRQEQKYRKKAYENRSMGNTRSSFRQSWD